MVNRILIALVVLLAAPKAECRVCAPWPCYVSANCGPGCACLKVGMELEGKCVSVD